MKISCNVKQGTSLVKNSSQTVQIKNKTNEKKPYLEQNISNHKLDGSDKKANTNTSPEMKISCNVKQGTSLVKKVPCFTLQAIFISGEVLVLAFLSDPSNLWLDIFCSRYGFFSFVLSLILTVCELFFTKEVPCFTLQDIFISGEVLVLAFLSDPSNLWLDIFCSRYGFFSFVLFLI